MILILYPIAKNYADRISEATKYFYFTSSKNQLLLSKGGIFLKTRLLYFFIISIYAAQSFAISKVRLCCEYSTLFPWIMDDKEGILDRDDRLYTDSYSFYKRKDSLIKYINGKPQNLEKKLIGAQLGHTIARDLKAKGHVDHNTFEIAIPLNLETAKVLSGHPKLKENIKISATPSRQKLKKNDLIQYI